MKTLLILLLATLVILPGAVANTGSGPGDDDCQGAIDLDCTPAVPFDHAPCLVYVAVPPDETPAVCIG